MEQRRFDFEKDWERRLNYLVINKGLRFDVVWKYVLDVVDGIINHL